MQSKRSRRRRAVALRILQLENSLRQLTARVLELESLIAAGNYSSPPANRTGANRLVDQIAFGLSLSRKMDAGEHSLVPSLQTEQSEK
jgi:hypothetical protein